MWQDTLIAICQIAFLPAMWPTVRGNDKPAFSTSVFNAIIVSIIAFALATLGLWLSFVTAVLIAATWTILASQKLKLNRVRQEAEAAENDDNYLESSGKNGAQDN